MIPHERSLVEKWKARPFALVGVNSDGVSKPHSMGIYRRKQKELRVNWRSFRDEGNGEGPSISDKWQVRSWPTLYYIDHKGVIRHKDITDKTKMEDLLEKLIVAAESQSKRRR